jgi:hypothetical protein
VNADGDAFPPLEAYFADPLNAPGGFRGIPAFITFPSVKDKEWSKTHPNKVCCQMLMMAEHQWFRDQIGDSSTSQEEAELALLKGPAFGAAAPARSARYTALKEQWKNAALEIFYLYYPKVRQNKVCFRSLQSIHCVLRHWL